MGLYLVPEPPMVNHQISCHLNTFQLPFSPIFLRLQQVEKIASSSNAFCALLRDGSVVAWGRGSEADTRLVSGQLVGVLDVCASAQAFAAITREGRVVTWGRPESGGDCRSVQEQIRYL